MDVQSNPVIGDILFLNINLVTPQRVKISISDVYGNYIRTLANGIISGGNQQFKLNSDITPGVYFIEAKGETLTETKRILIIK